MKFISKNLTFCMVLLISVNYSCKNFLQIDPPKDKIRPDQVFENDIIATSAITGIYSRMAVSNFSSGNYSSITTIAGVSADELISYSDELAGFYQAQVDKNSSIIQLLWSTPYSYIYTANSILEGLAASNGVSKATKMQLEGEAKFIRAFFYFYLVNLWGEIPLTLSSDYRVNRIEGKSSKDRVYAQIISDLIDAEKLMSSTYISGERVRPNKWAAKALLSRVYLYNENWELAAREASEIIDQKTTYSLIDDLDKVFLKNSTETIWQLMPQAGSNTLEGGLFILTATPIFVSLSPNLIPLFDLGDNRKYKWIKEYTNTTGKYYYPFKYKIKSSSSVSEYYTVIRLAEIHLIRAEARAKLDQPELALEDINVIRKRAGLVTPLTGLNQNLCTIEIAKQRQLELFVEWGHRWLDLKRNSLAKSVLAPLKGKTWQETDILYPFPAYDITQNPNLKQNLGY
ncbi:SusD family protein [Pedobacter sp. ok626]|uniref:RagB/SusD family nutrient uptake outer membrane protein n=1 Tax=Pedobacter sp. ok626 TaxID=1761882 RepID=UPI000888B658|nr:RagB/SusD family nutrient uptake outer membrane protein [Pedobacter sp. ok626]SDK10679.1 SusD family protein [Pedobacter sp. ok626]